MLLRSLTKHVRDQNWFAVFLDFFIVVAGILIAFQVTNWNEERAERRAEFGYLDTLEQDTNESLIEIAEITAKAEIQEKARETLYEYSIGTRSKLDPDKAVELIEAALWSFPSVEIRQTTFETLQGSGRLGILANEDLVTALQEMAALVEETETEKQHELYALERFGDPLLYDHVELAKIMGKPGLTDSVVRVPWLKELPKIEEIPAVFKTLQFRNSLLMRSALTNERKATYERMRLKYIEIGALIDDRQQELGVD
ncbi:MAG: hypothetical protein EX271_06750 [Acidimicrobiales bacterium]|nr:hypothetical protein [Hyphomonadaceae bacterium]RZV42042.1 MAG: hypothetical protein EX271_06750 [Acidimicrobiales bacterium]